MDEDRAPGGAGERCRPATGEVEGRQGEEGTMMDWETLYRRLVTRLVEIADDASTTGRANSHVRVIDYDLVARAHAQTAADLPMGEDG